MPEGEPLVVNDNVDFGLAVAFRHGNGLFHVPNEVLHIVEFVVGILESGFHVQDGPAVLVVASDVEFAGFMLLSEGGAEFGGLLLCIVV